MKFLGLGVLALSFSYSLSANDDLKAQRAMESKSYTVRVATEIGNVLTSEIDKGHGSGFIASLTPNQGIVFTNLHVVERNRRHARTVRIEFSDHGQGRESIEASVVFESAIADFAVLSFDPRKLSRVKGSIRAAPMADPQDLSTFTQPGASVMAAGNPLSSREICTFGTLNGSHVMEWSGQYLQSDAPINPGNSGGPLIHVNSGKVVGINSAKIMEADGMGFALPLDTAISEYRNWQRDPSYADEKGILAIFAPYWMKWFNGLGRETHVPDAEAEPGFTERYSNLWAVTAAAPSTGLEAGDLILKVDGIFIGDRGYRVRAALQSAKRSVDIAVLRANKVVHVQCPITNIGKSNRQADLRFLTFSGLVFDDVNEGVSYGMIQGKSRVVISEILPGSIASDSYMPLHGGFVIGVTVGERYYPVKALKDLKLALARLSPSDVSAVTLNMHIPLRGEHGDSMLDARYSMPILQAHPRPIVVPVDQVLSDDTHNLAALTERFDFTGFEDPSSRGGVKSLSLLKCAREIAGEGKSRKVTG